MKISNLERAAVIYRELPTLKEAKTLLSKDDTYVNVAQGDRFVALPRSIIPHLLRAVHLEINNLEKEVEAL